MEDQKGPKNNHEGAILLRVPTPKSSPAVVGPDATEHRSDEGEEEGEKNDPIGHLGDVPIGAFVVRIQAKDLPENPDHGYEGGEKTRSITQGDG